ncbi:MAG: hypothetical protein CMM47_02240, partial [Rhodospirillaceae bacterium]|nr:hypothetical protein [Rhodospirillaceae bacterium]
MLLPRKRRAPGSHSGDRRLLLESLEDRRVLDSTVVFNEIMYYPDGDETALEWIELYNQMSINMDISSWRLEGGIDYTFAEGTVIPTRGYVVVAIDPTQLASQTGFSAAVGPFTGRLSNGGEELRLINNADRVMNVVDYSDGGDWPVGPDGSGFSLAKSNQLLGNEASSWTTSSQRGGTPGASNTGESTVSLQYQTLPNPTITASAPDAPAGDWGVEYIFENSLNQDLTPVNGVPDHLDFVNGTPGAFAANLGSTYTDTQEYASDNLEGGDPDGFIEFDFGSEVTLGAWSFWDRTLQVDAVNQVSLTFSTDAVFDAGDTTMQFSSVHPPSDVSIQSAFVIDPPQTVRYLRWDVLTRHPGASGFDGAGEMRFYESLPDQTETTEEVVSIGDTANVLVPSDGSLGTTWTDENFVDTSWPISGPTGVGYESTGSSHVAYQNLTGAGGVSSFTGSLGHDFVVNSSINVTHLGVFDDGADGLNRTLTAELWSRSGNSGTKLADLQFTSADPGTLVDSNRIKPLVSPLSLNPGDYTIVGHGYGTAGGTELAGNEGQGGPSAAFKSLEDGGGVISFVGTSRLGTTPGAFPNFPQGGTVNYYSAGTFQFSTGAVSGLVATDIEAEMFGNQTTAYIRVPFSLTEADMVNTLRLEMTYNDGFVAYVNGVEVASRNEPATVSWNSAATTGSSNFVIETFSIDATGIPLVTGNNVLAIHGLNEVNNDAQFLIRPKLEVDRGPGGSAPIESSMVINEISPGGSSGFFVELTNTGDNSEDIDGMIIASSTGQEYSIPAQTIPSGGYVSINSAQFGFTPADEDTLFLYSGTKEQLFDAQHVTGRLRGRSPQHDGRWLYPDIETPAAANSFSFQDGIVINEIMYHHQPNFGTGGSPGTFNTTELLPIDNTAWRYNQTDGFAGGGIGTTWYTTTHPTTMPNWFDGPAPLGFETASLPLNINTTLTDPLTNNPFIITTYFETEFQFNGNLNDVTNLQLTHMIDDGAVFYLNGQEIDRYHLSGAVGTPVNVDALASSTVDNALLVISSVLPADALQVGTNRLSVEVHQQGTGSSDIVFAAGLSALEELSPPIEGTPNSENDEEWIELYNRGPSPVDLSGWRFDRGIRYEFPFGTTLAPDSYLVISNDAASLSADHPGVQVLGNFSGGLSNRGELLRLVDQNDNPADELHYFDAGKWPEYADGGGSSLELRDPTADHSQAQVWSATDESTQATWGNYSIRGLGTQVASPSNWNELVLGLLDSGTVLLDDISVVEDPDGAAIQLIQNGTFESDALGGEAATWRITGNHQGTVIVDPDNASNQVLQLVTTGATLQLSNKAETTLKDGANFVTLSSSKQYEVSFRARWVGGSNLVHSRLYFNRLPKIHQLSVPQTGGTPGTVNSTFAGNVGPTYSAFQHSPIVPSPTDTVTVTVEAEDPDGINGMKLWWSVDEGTWQSNTMISGGDDLYTGSIPAQANNSIVQFYVEGEDGNLISSTFPAAGQDSRALYKVHGSLPSTSALDSIEIIMIDSDNDQMYVPENKLSNKFMGITLVHNNTEVFYDIGMRLRGSGFGRNFIVPPDNFRVTFHPDQLFRGVQSRLAIDGTGKGPGNTQQHEIIITHMLSRAGAGVSLYNDLIRLTSPRLVDDGVKIMQLARYDQLFLDEQFGDDSGGSVFELDVNRYESGTTCCGVEGPKVAIPEQFTSGDIRNLGSNPENYRWYNLIKNHRDEQDFSPIVEMWQSFDLTGTALDDATQQILDIDSWMRTFAFESLVQNYDVYSYGMEHNVTFYIRPSDGRIMAFPFDMDHSMKPPGWPGSTSAGLRGGANLAKIIDLPHNLRIFYGHFDNFLDTSYNPTYMTSWINYFQSLTGENYSGNLSFLTARYNHALTLLPSGVPFAINGSTTLNVGSATSATIEGTGWIDVREIRTPGSDQPLAVDWRAEGTSYAETWEVDIPVAPGTNSYSFEAYDYQNNLIGTVSVDVTSTATNDVAGSLR